jgi:hypothetical protein
MSVIFRDAHQVRLQLKMKLSNYAWYKSSVVLPDTDGYIVMISVSHLDNQVRKLISPVIDGVDIRTEVH